MGKSIAGKAFSIRFFLNKSVKPIRVKRKERYALYAQVNYDYKNTKVPVCKPNQRISFYSQEINKTIYLSKEEFEYVHRAYEGKKAKDFRYSSKFIYNKGDVEPFEIGNHILPEFAFNIELIIKLGVKYKNFTLRGIGSKLNYFSTSLAEILQNDLKKKVEAFLRNPHTKVYNRVISQYNKEGEYTEGRIFQNEGYAVSFESIPVTIFEYFDDLVCSYYSIRETLPEDIIHGFELLFLLAASDLYIYSLSEFTYDFENISKSLDVLFEQGDFQNPNAIMKVDLENLFSRYISLLPPSLPLDDYKHRLIEFAKQSVDSCFQDFTP